MDVREQSHTPARSTGFTLVELMVTVSVLAIVLAMGVPYLQAFIQRQQVSADVESLRASIALARSEALKRSARVSLCPLAANATAEAPSCGANRADWQRGWIVYIDHNSTNLGYDEDDDQLLQVQASTRTRGISSNSSSQILSFMANGLTGIAATFDIQPADNTALCRELVLSAQGRVQTRSTCT